MRSEAQQRLANLFCALAPIPDGELTEMLAIFHSTHVARETILLRADERPQTLYFVASGILRLYYLTEDGTEFTKSFCMENEMVAAYSALLLGEPSRLFIQAMVDSELLMARYDSYRSVAAQHGCWQQVNQKIAETLFIKKEKRESSLLLDDAQTRYLQFLTEYPALETRVKQHHIASYLGITPVALSRIRRRLRGLNLG